VEHWETEGRRRRRQYIGMAVKYRKLPFLRESLQLRILKKTSTNGIQANLNS